MTELMKWFTAKERGGYSTCIHDGKLKSELWDGAVVPNCVGLVWTLFNIDHGRKGSAFKRIENADAKEIYARAKATGSGFLVSQTPRHGSICCYNIGTAGHVVYCLYYNGSKSVCLESNYSGTYDNNKATADTALRVMFGDPKSLYSNYQGAVVDFT